MSKQSIVLHPRARRRVPPARRAQLLREFERSGLSGPKFAARAGLPYATFAAWRRRHARAASSSPVLWLEAEVDAMPPPASLRVELGGGVAHLILTDAGQATLAARLIQALRQPC